jgi:hypothetical protein
MIMSYISQYFGKESQDLTYQDVVDFFAGEKEESDKIEFKAYVATGDEREKENGVIRSICAFLNSSGGITIWGAPVGQTIAGRAEKVFVGALSPVNRLIEKDYFINRLTDSITPAPVGITFLRLENAGQYIYILEAEQSPYSPHQFRNNYYMRIDGQTKPAPHHYIEALFKKITYPHLKGFIKIEELTNDGNRYYLRVSFIVFNLSKLQNEHNLYLRMVVTHGAVFQRSFTSPEAFNMGGHEFSKTDNVRTVYYNQPYRYTELIQLNPQELIQNGSQFEIWFYFGGKNSPLKLSKYTVRLNFNAPAPANLNMLMVNIDENKPFFEHSDALGLTEEERINQILGR